MNKEEHLLKSIYDIKFELNEIEVLINILKNDIQSANINLELLQNEITKKETTAQ